MVQIVSHIKTKEELLEKNVVFGEVICSEGRTED
jgi:hypothetical protein